MKKTISLPIAITIIVACAVLTGLLAWQYGFIPGISPSNPLPTPPEDETADWETYRNEKYGFEIKYPNDLERCFPDEKINFIAIILPISSSDIPEGWDADYFRSTACMYGSLRFTAETTDYSDIKKLKEYYWNLYEEIEGCNPELQIRETVFNELPALGVGSCDPMGLYAGTYTIFIYDQTKFTIEVSEYISREAGEELIKDVISTFRFID